MKKLLLPILGIAGVHLAFLLPTSIYTVSFDETGVVTRYGKITKVTKEAGSHFKLPFPFETVQIVREHESRRLEIGYRSKPESRTFSDENVAPLLWEKKHELYQKVYSESLAVTADRNIVDANVVVHYSIKDVKKYLTSFSDIQAGVKNAVVSILHAVIGHEELTAVIVEGKQRIQDKIKKQSQDLLNRYESGIRINAVVFEGIHPPVEVIYAFRDVASAREEMNTFVYNAETYGNSLIPSARAKAFRSERQAEARLISRDAKTKGHAARLAVLKKIYDKYPREFSIKAYFDNAEKSYSKASFFLLPAELVKNVEVIDQLKAVKQ